MVDYQQQLSWVIVDDLMVVFHRPGTTVDSQWHAFAKDVVARGVNRMLALSLGPVQMTSVQRKISGDVLRSRNVRVAGIADDRLTRGIVTAVSWMGVNIKAFSWAELDEAIKYLEVQAANVDKVRQLSLDYRATGPAKI